jgi:schlafen family protein
MTTQQTLPSANDSALDEIATLVAKRGYGSFTLRLEVLKPNRFVTACLSFRDLAASESEQEILEYSDVTLATFTCHIDMWRDFARRLIVGELEVSGTKIPATFSYARRQEELYVNEGATGPRDCFRFVHSNVQDPYSGKALLGIGLRPYANLADASARYVHQSQAAISQINEVNTFLIALPTRNEIVIAEWLPGEVRVQFVSDGLPEYQFDLLFWEPARVTESQSIESPTRDVKVPVPSGTTTVVGHLVAPSGAIAQSFVLNAPYAFVGDAKSSLSYEQQVRADILAGESEVREMKAFFNPDGNTAMRDRVLESAIGFANTSGGHIYVGVEDHGGLSGNSKLVSTIRKNGTPQECAEELSAKLRKYIIENTRPVIEKSALEIKIGTEWVIRLRIEQSEGVVGTHTNHVFVRSGASNRIPEPGWFTQRQMGAPSSTLGFLR